MQCKRFNSRLSLYYDGLTGLREAAAMRRHMLRCPACALDAQMQERLRSAIAEVSVPVEPVGFRGRVMNRALAARPAKAVRARSLWVGTVVSAAAAAGVAVLLWVVPSAHAPTAAKPPVVALRLHRPRPVGFVFHVQRRLAHVRVVVELPQGVKVVGRSRQRLAWHVNLERGSNLLTLPLVASRLGGGLVRTEVDTDSGSVIARAALMARTLADNSDHGVVSPRFHQRGMGR